MNKIVRAARLAKGLSEKEAAGKLNMEASVYKELELGIAEITEGIAEAFESVYNIPAEYFTDDTKDHVKNSMKALEKQKEIIASADIENVSLPAATHLSLARFGLDALIARHEQLLLLKRVEELLEMNTALRQLYEDAKQRLLVLEHSIK